MELRFSPKEAEQMTLAAIRAEWPNMIADNDDVTVDFEAYRGIKITIEPKEVTQ